MNGKVWDLFYEADKVREMLSRKIQEETLRTYLFTYSKVYNSISIVSISLKIFIFFKKGHRGPENFEKSRPKKLMKSNTWGRII